MIVRTDDRLMAVSSVLTEILHRVWGYPAVASPACLKSEDSFRSVAAI